MKVIVMTTSRRTSISSSLSQTDQSQRSDAILQLGEKLVEELGLTQAVDTLGRWMAHYVAELISESEKGSSSERKQKQAVAAQMILQLWQHRAEFPNGSRPLREFDSVLGVLQSLDLSNPCHRYFRG